MKLLKMFGIAIALLLAISQIASAQSWKTTPTYDAVKDFSTQSNPNGVWSYGYLTSWRAPLTLFAWGGTCNISGISWWFTSQCQGYTSIFHNDTTKKICWATVCEPPSYLGLNPAGYSSVLRWTAPSAGKFLVQVTVEGLDCCTTSTYFHVLLNSKHSFLKAPINSYQWPLYFQPRAWRLSAGDTVDFIVDEGKDGGWGNDSTGVEVKIWSLGQKKEGERQ